ncbi:MAG: DUF5710 domain-containing protein [Methylobacter sp.]|nr:DUF5710 domain-containing protein [Methylobacter sp.]
MASQKTYLDVPYAQKDAAKALGARWDAANKKWYVPAGMDVTLFAIWQPQSIVLEPTLSTAREDGSRAASTTINSSAGNAARGVFTYATDKDFVAYSGDEAPWD